MTPLWVRGIWDLHLLLIQGTSFPHGPALYTRNLGSAFCHTEGTSYTHHHTLNTRNQGSALISNHELTSVLYLIPIQGTSYACDPTLNTRYLGSSLVHLIPPCILHLLPRIHPSIPSSILYLLPRIHPFILHLLHYDTSIHPNTPRHDTSLHPAPAADMICWLENLGILRPMLYVWVKRGWMMS